MDFDYQYGVWDYIFGDMGWCYLGSAYGPIAISSWSSNRVGFVVSD